MELFKIIKKPVVTEKTQKLELEGVYTFFVNPLATKVDIRSAFERLYGEKVVNVNIVKTREKFRNTKNGVSMKRKPSTKALVTLEKGKRVADLMKIKTKD